MNILVVCQYYNPEPFNISFICEELVKQGNNVTVLTGVPNYPMGRVYKDYKWFKRRREVINGVDVHRCFTIGRRSGIIWRFINYYSFCISSALYSLSLKDNFDVVFVNQLSPVMMAEAGIWYKKRHGKKMVLYCLDLWPESLTTGGIKEGSLIYKVFEKISSRIYKNADKILITSESFKEYFTRKFEIKDVYYLPQYAEDGFDPENCVKEESETIDLLFAGNIGIVQDLDTVIKAAQITSDIRNLKWHIVGDGSELGHCKKLADKLNLENITFYGRRPVEEMPDFYSKADAMLITLNANELVSKTLPAKMQSYMAAAKPIIGAANGEIPLTIKAANCGFCGPAGDAAELANNVRKFISFENKKVLGANAKDFYDRNFSKEKFIKELQKHLEV